MSESTISAYAGDYEKALELAENVSRRLFRSSFRYFQLLRVTTDYSLAYSALRLASTRENRKPLLKIARERAKRLTGEEFPTAAPYISYINGSVAHLQGDDENAVKYLRESVVAFDAIQFKLDAAATNRQLGRLLGGDEGRVLVAQADATMKEEGIVRPDRIAAMLAPGFGD